MSEGVKINTFKKIKELAQKILCWKKVIFLSTGKEMGKL